jgi:hypothetical protein
LLSVAATVESKMGRSKNLRRAVFIAVMMSGALLVACSQPAPPPPPAPAQVYTPPPTPVAQAPMVRG